MAVNKFFEFYFFRCMRENNKKIIIINAFILKEISQTDFIKNSISTIQKYSIMPSKSFN